MPADNLLYDVRGAVVTARADVAHKLVAETDRLVEEAISATVRQVSLPRTILAVRIDHTAYMPLIIGGRHEAKVIVEAISVGNGEPIAEGSFKASAFALDRTDGDTLLAERIARRIAAEFRLKERGGTTLATALFP
ncbi:hypothetical protein [Rhizobium sp. LCM 4573]|uniref:hypothetical protein n=1 Tax=Rhizobium sp. LCM 4573 TaxID=1848291 RepID=UPI0010424D17|nr:hypothetical protein [Rhizobium sp. LCM 4573]